MEDCLIAAVINARVASAVLKCEAMRTLNLERQMEGKSLAYGEEAFNQIIEDEGIHHNGVWGTIHEHRD